VDIILPAKQSQRRKWCFVARKGIFVARFDIFGAKKVEDELPCRRIGAGSKLNP
jgi:hypothetical protein